MTDSATLSRRRRLRFYGWGYADEELSSDEDARVRQSAGRYGALAEVPVPRENEFALRAPRIAAPTALARIVS